MRAVLDVDVLVSALLAPRGAPAQLILEWRAGAFDLVVSAAVLAELTRVLAYPKIARRIPPDDGRAFVAMLAQWAELVPDPAATPSVRSDDPADDYLIMLAQAERAFLVSGDRHLTDLAGSIPVKTPAEFLATLE
jgi:putative PIN family toxin of toxin-antitoxin system